MSLRFGFVGTGAMAEAMLAAVRHAPDVRVSAVCSHAGARARAFAEAHGIDGAYDGLADMLASADINAVYVANRTRDHAAASIAALDAGKHVLCEKPFAIHGEEGAQVIAAAKASGRLFMEGLWTHFLPAYQRVKALADAQEVGAPKHLTAAYGYPSSPDARPRLFAPEDGGVVLDIAVYPLSLALRLLGDVGDLHADITRNTDGIDTHASLQLRHVNGAVSQLAASFDAMTSNTASLACAEGLISIPAPLFGAETVMVDRFATGAAPAGASSKLKAALKQNPLLRRAKAAIGGNGEHHPYGANQYLLQLEH
ncbi:MAG: Gfo/Idh/MocA family protein, partial [Hyphococcus sp.]